MFDLKLLKWVIIVLAVATSGLVAGYFSQPLYEDFLTPTAAKPRKSTAVSKASPQNNTQVPHLNSNSLDSVAPKAFISAEKAISAVKSLPLVQEQVSESENRGTILIFKADQQPSGDYPVWHIEVKETYPDQVPDISIYKVEAFSGNILDLKNDELKIAGLELKLAKWEVTKSQGKQFKSKFLYDQILKLRAEIYDYNGLQVVFDSRHKVGLLKASSPAFQGPRGIKVGAFKKDIIKTLGKANIAQSNLLIYNSLEDNNIRFAVKLDNQDIVTEMTVFKIDQEPS